MLNKKRKGFTIVELVIVIAVIAVLAAVLIPTFSNVISKANESAALQEVQSAYIEALADALGSDLKDKEVKVGDFTFKFEDATGQNAAITSTGEFGTKYPNAKVENGVVVLGPASGGNGGGNGGSGEEEQMTPEQQLRKVLTEGGTFTLAEDMTIDEALTIAAGKTATIDLAGNTLELKDPSDETGSAPVLTVLGSLTVRSTGSTGSIVLDEEDENYGNPFTAGIYVGDPTGETEGGSLSISGVELTINRYNGVQNDASITLDSATFNVNNGVGLYNCGTAMLTNTSFTVTGGNNGGYGYWSDCGTDTITGGSFIASGTGVTLLCIEGGTATVTGTSFVEGTGFVAYDRGSPIVVMDYFDYSTYLNNEGSLTLSGVTVTTSTDTSEYAAEGANICNAHVSNGGVITIESGTFNGPFACGDEYSAITIKGGTFSGKTLSDLETVDAMKQALCYYPANSDWQVTYEGGICTLTVS